MVGTSLRNAMQSLIHFERSQLTFPAGMRKALVVTVLLVAGVATGQMYIGLMLVIGAFSVGFTDQGGAYLPRIRTMLLASAAIASSALIGSLAAPIGWLIPLMMMFWGFGAGLLVSVGQTTTTSGLQGVVALAISSNFHLAPGQALETAGLLLAGGLLQTAVALAPWPFTRWRYERAALASAYLALAASAEQLADAQRGLDAAEKLVQAGQTLVNRVPRFGTGPAGETFRALLDQGWGIDEELLALAELRARLANQGRDHALRHLDALADAAAELLRALADSLNANRIPGNLEEPLNQLEEALKGLSHAQSDEPLPTNFERGVLAAALERARALGGQIRLVLRVYSSWEQTGESAVEADGIRRPAALQPQSPLAILRANLTLRSMVFRHSLRLGLTLAVAALLYEVLPFQRGYWIPLTVVLVLKPDFTTTITRGLARGGGTLLGAALADLLIAAIHPGTFGLVAFVAVLAWAAYVIFQASYVLFSLFLTGYVVALVSLAGTPPLAAAVARVEDTLIGSGLALGAILLWPAWEQMHVPQHLAELLEAESGYMTLVLGGYLDPATLDPAEARHARLKARLARSNAEASVQRSLSEPARFRTDKEVALGLLASDARLLQGTLALEALFWHTRSKHQLPGLRPLIDDLHTAMQALARAVRAEPADGRWPSLRDDHHALVEWLETAGPADPEAHARLTFVVAEVEQLVESLSTMHHLLAHSQRFSAPEQTPWLFAWR